MSKRCTVVTHLTVLSLEGDLTGFSASPAQPVPHLVLQQGCVAQVFIDGVGGHLGDVLCCLGLDVECDQPICHKVVDGLKALLPDKVFPIMVEAEVLGLISKAGSRIEG